MCNEIRAKKCVNEYPKYKRVYNNTKCNMFYYNVYS